MKKVILGSLLCLALSGVLLGCSKKMTVEDLFTKSRELSKDMTSIDMLLNIDVNGKFTLGTDTTMDLSFKTNTNVMSEFNRGIYLDGSVDMNMFGTDEKTQVKSYIKLDDDKMVQYTYNDDTKSYDKVESENYLSSVVKLDDIDFSPLYSHLTLADETETGANNQEVYHVSGSVEGSVLKSLTDKLSSVNLDGMVADLDFYFSVKDCKLVAVDIDLAKSDFTKLAGGINSSLTNESTSVSFDVFHIQVTINSINNYVFKVSDEIKE